MNLRPSSEALRQSTRLCTVLRSALRLVVVALMVSGCSFLSTVQPADPILSTLVSQDHRADAEAELEQRPLDDVSADPVDVEIVGAASDAPQHVSPRDSRSEDPFRERLTNSERRAGQARLLLAKAAVEVKADTVATKVKKALASPLVDAPAPITPVDSLFFSANQAALVEPSAPLDAVVALLEANPAGLIVLEGHADTGEVAASALSWRRAQGARDYLLDRGVPGYRVRIRSQGANNPSPIATREAGAQNRRVTLLLRTDNS